MVFASTLFSRAVDPVVPKIAADLGIDVKTAALLSTAFTFPYAFTQPALGTIADFFGKTRLMNVSLALVVTTTLVCAFANSFPLLVAMRVIAGNLRRRHLSGRCRHRWRSRCRGSRSARWRSAGCLRSGSLAISSAR